VFYAQSYRVTNNYIAGIPIEGYECGVRCHSIPCSAILYRAVPCNAVSDRHMMDPHRIENTPSVLLPHQSCRTEWNRLRTSGRNVWNSLVVYPSPSCPPPPYVVRPLSVPLPSPVRSSSISAAAGLRRRVKSASRCLSVCLSFPVGYRLPQSAIL
jgi:hypothetical protein